VIPTRENLAGRSVDNIHCDAYMHLSYLPTGGHHRVVRSRRPAPPPPWVSVLFAPDLPSWPPISQSHSPPVTLFFKNGIVPPASQRGPGVPMTRSSNLYGSSIGPAEPLSRGCYADIAQPTETAVYLATPGPPLSIGMILYRTESGQRLRTRAPVSPLEAAHGRNGRPVVVVMPTPSVPPIC